MAVTSILQVALRAGCTRSVGVAMRPVGLVPALTFVTAPLGSSTVGLLDSHRQYSMCPQPPREQFWHSSGGTSLPLGLGKSTLCRGLSTSPTPCNTNVTEEIAEETPKAATEEPLDLVYTGILSATVIRVKMLSVASCLLTTAGAPIIVGLSRPELSFSMQCATASGLAMFGLFTTGLLQWFVSPYILSIRCPANGDKIVVERLNMFAQRTIDTIPLADVRQPASSKPLSTFRTPSRIYFFDKDHWEPEMHRDVLETILEQTWEPIPGEEDHEESDEEEEPVSDKKKPESNKKDN